MDDATSVPLQDELSIESASAFLFRDIALGVAHQLTNDLQSIGSSLLLTESFLESVPLPLRNELSKLVAETLRHVERARQALYVLTRRGRQAGVRIAECDLIGEILRVAVHRETQAAARRKIPCRWTTSYGANTYIVSADGELLLEAVAALLDNAGRAVRDNSTGRREVFISVRPVPPKNVRIEIADTGVGVSPDLVKRIFEPFFTTRRTGTGLGLYFARVITEHFGGKLQLDRSIPGKGTTFSLTLPYVREIVSRRGRLTSR